MQQDFRALARRHMWLSWWWGMGLVGVPGFLVAGGLIALEGRGFWWVLFFPGPLFYLGLPALFGSLVRLPLMRRVFKTATSPLASALRAAFVFDGSVLLFWLLWQAYSWLTAPYLFRVLPAQQWFGNTPYFFGLSLPWLLSSVAAAWWVQRGALRAASVLDAHES